MELEVTYSFQGRETANIMVCYEDLEFLEDFLNNYSNNYLIDNVEKLEEAIEEFIWTQMDLTDYLPSTLDEILNISSESPLIQQLIVKYHHLITTNCCVNMVGNYYSTCGKKLK